MLDKDIIQQAKSCDICAEFLPHGTRPVFVVHPTAKINIIGQAPGRRVHASGIPWDDQSGKRLRQWMGVDDETFYNPEKIAIMPMGFCYPGTGKSGDLPPRKECAPRWHQPLLNMMPDIQLTLLIGAYAQKAFLKKEMKKNLTETVMHWEDYLPNYLVLPHPSPRNQYWLKKNPWFESGVLPFLKGKIEEALK